MSTRSVLFGFGFLVLAAVAVTSIGGPGMVEQPVAFNVYLDPLPRPVVPFCPDCSVLPGTAGTKATVKVPTGQVPTGQSTQASPVPRSTAR